MATPLSIYRLGSSGSCVSVQNIGIALAMGPTVPSAARGYAPACLFLDTTTGLTYSNFGDYESSDFVGGSVDTLTRDGGQTLPAIPWSDNAEIALSSFLVSYAANGLDITGTLGHAENIDAFNHRGYGVSVGSDCQFVGRASHENYIGAKLASSDANIALCRLFNNRDANLFIAAGSGSANCQSLNNHCYGSRIACYNQGSRFFRAVNDTYADAYIGFFGGINVSGANSLALTNCLFQHNLVRDCVFRASSMHMVNCIVAIGKDVTEAAAGITISDDGYNVLTRLTRGTGNCKVGVELGDKCTIRGGHVFLDTFVNDSHHASGVPCEAIWVIHNSNCVVIDTYLEDAQAIDGGVGIRLKGTHKQVKIDVMTSGFHETNSRILVIDDPTNCKALDITLRVDAPVLKGQTATEAHYMGNYIDTASGWTGVIKFVNGTTGVTTTVTDGSAI